MKFHGGTLVLTYQVNLDALRHPSLEARELLLLRSRAHH